MSAYLCNNINFVIAIYCQNLKLKLYIRPDDVKKNQKILIMRIFKKKKKGNVIKHYFILLINKKK